MYYDTVMRASAGNKVLEIEADTLLHAVFVLVDLDVFLEIASATGFSSQVCVFLSLCIILSFGDCILIAYPRLERERRLSKAEVLVKFGVDKQS